MAVCGNPERDSETGMDYAINRYYNSGYGRFMTADLLAGHLQSPQSLNRYAYVTNDPVNLPDPLGLYINCSIFAKNFNGEGDKPDGADCHFENGDIEIDTDPGEPLVFLGGGGGGSGRTPSQKLPDAIQRALNALKNLECAAAVGHGVRDDSDSVIPASEVLQDLSSNVKLEDDHSIDPSHYGKITFGTLNSTQGTISAATHGSTWTDNSGSTTSVTITINTAAGSFVNGSADDQTVTILHELGHAIADLFGPSASMVKSDNESTQQGRDQSAANTKLIKERCHNGHE